MEIIGAPFERELKKHLTRLFKEDAESLEYVSNHPIGVAAYHELRKRYQEKHIPKLLKKVLSNWDKIAANKRLMRILLNPAGVGPPGERMLASAIALTCRSSENQCPTGMSEFYKRAGGFSFVHKVGEMVGEPLKYAPEKRLKSILYRLKTAFGLDNDFIRTCLNTWRDDRVPVTPSYAGGLVHWVSQITDRPLKEKEIAAELSVSENSVKNNSRKIHRKERNRTQKKTSTR